MDDGEMAAAFDALDTITKTLEKHWMRKPPVSESVEEPETVVEIEFQGDPVEDTEELSPDATTDPDGESEPLRLTEFMGPRKGAIQSTPLVPQETVKRKRGRPPKVR